MLTSAPLWQATSAVPMYVQVSDTFAGGYEFYDGTPPEPTVASGEITATPVGGTAPYTYAWTEVDHSPTFPYPCGATTTDPTSATTHWTFTQASPGDWVVQGYYKCTVTDSAGSPAVVDSVEVEVILEQST